MIQKRGKEQKIWLIGLTPLLQPLFVFLKPPFLHFLLLAHFQHDKALLPRRNLISGLYPAVYKCFCCGWWKARSLLYLHGVFTFHSRCRVTEHTSLIRVTSGLHSLSSSSVLQDRLNEPISDVQGPLELLPMILE